MHCSATGSGSERERDVKLSASTCTVTKQWPLLRNKKSEMQQSNFTIHDFAKDANRHGSGLLPPMISGYIGGELISWQRLTVFSLLLSITSICCEVASFSLTYEVFDNTAQIILFGLYDCPSKINTNGGGGVTSCDSPQALTFVQSALGVTVFLTAFLLILGGQAYLQWASGGAPASTGWARNFFRPFGCLILILQSALLSTALGVKDISLKSWNGFSSNGSGRVCLVAALICTCVELAPFILLATDDVYVSNHVRAAVAVELSKAISSSPLNTATVKAGRDGNDNSPRAFGNGGGPAFMQSLGGGGGGGSGSGSGGAPYLGQGVLTGYSGRQNHSPPRPPLSSISTMMSAFPTDSPPNNNTLYNGYRSGNLRMGIAGAGRFPAREAALSPPEFLGRRQG